VATTLPTVNGNEDARPYGLIPCVGLTGSGKTTTLHSALGHINTPDMKMWTAEDPVEITQAGLRQVQMQPEIGFDFAAALRAFLRADPDVIIVGEMRDRETASVGEEASLTGHLVPLALHTSSAPETNTQLIDRDVDPFSFADALLGVLAQRLARSLCQQCREQYVASEDDVATIIEALGQEALRQVDPSRESRPHRGRGGEACGDTGYKGRIALHELLVCGDEVRHAVSRH
jgi:type II secretory ATPase GspE/PulE/Tfp pilus assembly ATPase PilB-like protein